LVLDEWGTGPGKISLVVTERDDPLMSATSASSAGAPPIVCSTTTRVGAADVARLPVPAQQAARSRYLTHCELGAGHQGCHTGFLSVSDEGDRWWWLRWSPPTREVVQIDPCTAENETGTYRDDCLLPDRHSGLHSFDLRPTDEGLTAPLR